MTTRHGSTALRFRVRSIIPMGTILVLFFLQSAMGAPQQGGAKLIASDQTGVSLSNKFFSQNLIGMKANGDVFFGSGGVTFGYWEAATGTKTRLLQVNDPMPGYPGSVIRTAGAPLQVNSAGHAAMINTWAADGVKNPAGVFVYDGSQYKKVALAGEAAPGVPGGIFTNFRDLRVNASDMVAFVAELEPVGEHMLGVFLGSPTGAPIKIATSADLDPLMNNPNNIYIIGVDNVGNVAFLCEAYGNPSGSLVVGSPTGVLSVIQTGSSAPGTAGNFFLSSNRANYSMNASGDVAFFAQVFNDPTIFAGLWVRRLAGGIQKLAVIGDSAPSSLGGTYSSFTFRGFNDNGQVLYSSNIAGSATTNQALLLKTLTTAAQVVCYRNQTFSGAQQIDSVGNAFLGQTGKSAVFTSLKNPYGRVLLLCDPATSPVVIVWEGDATPAGGTYMQIGSFRMNDAAQVAFRSDILPLNANGLFLWTSGSPIQSIVNTNETLLAGANRALYDYYAASDDEAIFWGFSGEGKDTIFTRSLRPGDSTIRRVIGDGDAEPSGGVIAYINRPAINNLEEIVVYSGIVGGAPYPNDALWLSKPGSALQKLVDRAVSAPGSAGGNFSGFPSNPRINNQSEVAFYANIGNSTGGSNAGIFLISSSGTVQNVVRIGDASPAGGTFSGIYNTIYLSDIGTVAFRATSQLSPTQSVDGYFVGSATATPVKLMAVGDSWGGDIFSGIKYSFKMNSAGQVAFGASLTIGDNGIFIASPGSAPVAIALADNESPTPGSLIELENPDVSLDINSSGQVAFWGVYLITPEPDLAHGTGYFIGSAGTSPVLVVAMGQALPGGGTCPPFIALANRMALADSGELAMYIPGISGAADLPRYIIAGSDGTLRRLASVGGIAPDTGSKFGRLGSVGANSAGAFFFHAILVGGSAKQGLFENSLLTPPPAATLVSPLGTISTSLPSYTWNAVPASTWYYLWVDDTSTFGKVRIWYTAEEAGCAGGTGTCSVKPSTVLAHGAAQWWIQTWNEAGYGPWSAGMSFTVTGSPPGKAVLLSPSGAIGTSTPTYIWNAVPGATWYLLWVNDGFAGPKIQAWYTAAQVTLTGFCGITPSTPVRGAAQWWIQTWNEAGYGPWSDGMSFTVSASPPGKAELVVPIGTIGTSAPAYIWNAVSGAAWYLLWVNDSFAGPKIQAWYTAAQAGCALGAGTCSVAPPTALAQGAARWWIQTWNEAGYGPWSDGMSFTVSVSSPGKATLVSPSGAIGTTTPTYIWNAVPGAAWYLLLVNDGFASPKIQAWYTAAQAGCALGIGTCAITPTTPVTGAAQWWIQTWNEAGFGPQSDGMTFTVDGAPLRFWRPAMQK